MVCPLCAELGDPMLCERHEMEIVARHATPPTPPAPDAVVKALIEACNVFEVWVNNASVHHEVEAPATRRLIAKWRGLAASRAPGGRA